MVAIDYVFMVYMEFTIFFLSTEFFTLDFGLLR